MAKILRVLRWLDRNLWSVSVIVFVIAVAVITIARYDTGQPVLLAHVPTPVRQSFYSSLTSTSGSLLGFTIAAVAILASFTPRAAKPGRAQAQEKQLAKARSQLIAALLSASASLLTLLILSSLAITLDNQKTGNFFLTSTITGAALSCVAGLLVGGVGLSLAIVEYSRH